MGNDDDDLIARALARVQPNVLSHDAFRLAIYLTPKIKPQNLTIILMAQGGRVKDNFVMEDFNGDTYVSFHVAVETLIGMDAEVYYFFIRKPEGCTGGASEKQKYILCACSINKDGFCDMPPSAAEKIYYANSSASAWEENVFKHLSEVFPDFRPSA